MGKFRYKRSVAIPYDVQGYIYFASRRYKRMSAAQRRRIDELCREAGGNYAEALKEFVTTDAGAIEICQRHYISQSTLERIVRQYYIKFSESI